MDQYLRQTKVRGTDMRSVGTMYWNSTISTLSYTHKRLDSYPGYYPGVYFLEISFCADHDKDGIPDRLDLDSDNDGIQDVIEAGGEDPDGDGVIGTGAITDTDGDGLSDIVDTDNGGTPLANPDTDGDGHSDILDSDSDNDGIQDVIEAGGVDPDGDGVIGNGAITDSDGDGFSEITDTDEGGSNLACDNFDNDGFPDYVDIDQ